MRRRLDAWRSTQAICDPGDLDRSGLLTLVTDTQAKARALVHGRLAATRDDVRALAAPVLRHRILLSFAAEAERKSPDDVVAALLAALPAPGSD